MRAGFPGRMTPARGSVFNPSLISNLQLWLDASDLSTITESGGAVSQWSDKSGQGNSATASGSARPTTGATTLNSKNVIDFATNDWLTPATALYSIPNGDNTVFVIAKRDTETGSSEAIFQFADTPTNAWQIFFSSTAGSISYKNRLSAGGDLVSAGNTNTDFNLITVIHSGATGQSLSINAGTPVTNANGENVAGIDDGAIGARFDGSANYLTGSIAEILIYDKALSTSEINQVNAYLLNKWGLL